MRIFTLLCLSFICACHTSHFPQGRSVTLPGSAAAEFLSLCSRTSMPQYDTTWNPSETVIRDMEFRLYFKIAHLEANGCCIINGRILDLDEYYFQYVGIIINDRKLIYINAYCQEHLDALRRGPEASACDGGRCYWGVLYDVRSKTFHNLSINGNG